jgi:hypothetical protein
MVDYPLTLLTIDFLKLMITLYQRDDVDYNLFCECCFFKVKFLEDILPDISTLKEREEAMLIISKVKTLIGTLV